MVDPQLWISLNEVVNSGNKWGVLMYEYENTLRETARALVAPNKGILAADESFSTIEKRFKTIDVASTADSRRAYREILFTTSGSNEFISGVILFDETIRQTTSEGQAFTDVLLKEGIIPGIKVDKGTIPLPFSRGEKITEGLDGLRARLKEYRQLGARFAKWRAVLAIGEETPSRYCIHCNGHALGRYAALCQEEDLVPIVEPEVLMEGAHSIDRCEKETGKTLEAVFGALDESGILLEGILLKPNMVLPGKDCTIQAHPEEVAEATLRCFLRHVPAAVPGVVFLSGGQSDVQATKNLNAMNAMGKFPWELSFSFGRALQAPVLEAWQGESRNIEAAKKAFYHRASCNGAARSGSYNEAMEKEVA